MPIHDWTRVPEKVFSDFHATLIPEIKRTLNAGLLPLEYYALVERISSGKELASSTCEPAVHSKQTYWDDWPILAVVVRRAENDSVVAAIEILTPHNKCGFHALKTFGANCAALVRAGIHLLVVDLFPPGPSDPNGIHSFIWPHFGDDDFELPDQNRIVVASYKARPSLNAYVCCISVGKRLDGCPFFIDQETHIDFFPLETMYSTAFDAVPKRWRQILEADTQIPDKP